MPQHTHAAGAGLVEMSGHIRYRIEMLLRTYWMLEGFPKLQTQDVRGSVLPTVRDGLAESFALHARALKDFFWRDRSNRPDDVFASGFFAEASQWTAIRGEEPEELLEFANKAIMHVTSNREKWKLDGRDYQSIRECLRRVIQLFAQNVPADKVAPDFREGVVRTIQDTAGPCPPEGWRAAFARMTLGTPWAMENVPTGASGPLEGPNYDFMASGRDTQRLPQDDDVACKGEALTRAPSHPSSLHSGTQPFPNSRESGRAGAQREQARYDPRGHSVGC